MDELGKLLHAFYHFVGVVPLPEELWLPFVEARG
jgi:hypothetical protein